VCDAGGQTAISADERDESLVAMAATHDPAWDAWEHAAYQVLADALASARARPLAFNGHQAGTQAVVAWAQ
jgi:hypothetical protein